MKAGWIRMPERQIGIVWEAEQRGTFLSVGLWLADKDSPVSSPHTVNQQPTPSDTTMKYKLSSLIMELKFDPGRWQICIELCFVWYFMWQSHNLLICEDFFYLSTQLIIPALSLIPNNPTSSHWLRYSIFQIVPSLNQASLDRVVCIFVLTEYKSCIITIMFHVSSSQDHLHVSLHVKREVVWSTEGPWAQLALEGLVTCMFPANDSNCTKYFKSLKYFWL